MSRLLDDDNDLLQQRDRELTLSTGSILAIFLGLVLLCAIFFGFGYNLGRKSTTVAPNTAATEPAESSEPASTPSSSTFDNFKPSPSSPSGSSAAASAPASVPEVTLPVSSTATPAATPSTTSETSTSASHSANTTPHPPPAVPKTPPAHSPAPAATPVPPAASPAGAFVVQVAAVSRKDDADLLVNALRTKGYTVAERTEPQDKLIHIQVGPFSTRADAEAMREKLIVDGYNAIVK